VNAVRCLVADDHPALLNVLADYLSDLGLEVVATVADGAQAIGVATGEALDAAVVDYRMPRLSGVELLTRLREVSPQTKLVVYTADADEQLVREALGAGADAVLLKESPLQDLGRALEATLAGSTYLDPALSQFALMDTPAKPALTERETAVLELVAQGLSHEEIGTRLSISSETVRSHVRKACERLDASTRTQAVAIAMRLGLIA
jgi:DNA-binding NarL/FixJ family response regulator